MYMSLTNSENDFWETCVFSLLDVDISIWLKNQEWCHTSVRINGDALETLVGDVWARDYFDSLLLPAEIVPAYP